MTAPPTTFDSFNARWLPANKVAETFIPTEEFDVLIKPTDTIIVGPRGSGKTSLLKMLQTVALEAWVHSKSEQFREAIKFTGVFIPTDVSWNQQLASLGKSFEHKYKQALEEAVFTSHVLHCFCSAMESRLISNKPPTSKINHRRIELQFKDEKEIVEHLCDSWKIESKIPTLASLRTAMRKRISEIWEFARSEQFADEEKRSERFAKHPFIHLELIEMIRTGVEIFNDRIGEKNGTWALLFDELEIAPKWVLRRLLNELRGSDDRILFKLSISPHTVIDVERSSAQPTSGNDFRLVSLWFWHKRRASQFTKELFAAVTKSILGEAKEPSELLGKSQLKGEMLKGRRDVEPYSEGSPQHELLLRMARLDRSVARYLENRDIDLNNINQAKASKPSLLRKILPSLIIRDFFLKKGKDEKLISRSRKKLGVYGGAETFLEMTEGNPRWLIGMLRELLQQAKSKGSKPIDATKQVDSVLRNAERFCSLLKTIPAHSKNQKPCSLLDILEKIGNFFHRSTVTTEFTGEPFGQFIVDGDVSEEVVKALSVALNAGAIVLMPASEQEIVIRDLRGHKFRLTYLFAPKFRFNPRLGREIDLSRILSPKVHKITQGELFTNE